MLPQSSNKQALIIPTRLALDPTNKTLMITVLIRALNIIHMILIPMNADNSVREQSVVSPGAGHRVFEEHGVAHGFIGAGAQLLQKRGFHVAVEFLFVLA